MILGIDLSTKATAAVAVPLDWDGRWSRVRSMVAGEPLTREATDAERAIRTASIAARVVAFARETGAGHAWIESYAFDQRTAAHTLGELGGVVRLELVRAGVQIHTAQMATARKLLLGKLPRSGVKDAVQATLRAAGAPVWTPDECDAFVAANFGLAEMGGFCFAQEAA